MDADGGSVRDAPGAPGIAPTWTSSAKDVVGCSLGPSRLWFTTGYGIVNEVFSPRIDIPQIRDLGFIVADGRGFWVEVKRMDDYETTLPAAGIPVVRVVHRHARFRLELEIVVDPARDVLLVEVTLDGDEGLRPYALLAPHLGGTGWDNRAALASRAGRRVLTAEQGPFGLALAARDRHGADALLRGGAGYVGTSDGWHDFATNGAMTWEHPRAGPGNVALLGELSGSAVLALALASSAASATTLALAALQQDPAEVRDAETRRWRAWHAANDGRGAADPEDLPAGLRAEYATSAMVLHAHRDVTFPGAMVASLCIPWGNTSDDIGGYHLVWPRDLVESAGALLALGARDEARDALVYLVATQMDDGGWHQNQWLGGSPYWSGVQLDEAGFPVLLAAGLAEMDALGDVDPRSMVRRALRFIALEGPSSDQDRWEEDRGVNTFTLAVCIAALVSGARLLDGADRDVALELADFWNAHIEAWTTASGTALARRFGVERYYVRVAPPAILGDAGALDVALPIRNLGHDPSLPAEEQVGVDFLQLVRFGLRGPDDPVVTDSLKVADGLLEVTTPGGPSWHRYNGDGYGEHPDGSPFDGTGQGRAWPLLTGERGHYEVARGGDARPWLRAMAAMSGPGGLIPEQVWDAEPVPSRGLLPGRPTGSAMPLVWAHAEYVKLAASATLGRPFDRPSAVWDRYQGVRPAPGVAFWSPAAPVRRMSPGMDLALLLPRSATVHWGLDGWSEPRDGRTREAGLGLWRFDLAAPTLGKASRVVFTWRWDDSSAWTGVDEEIEIMR